LVTVTDDPPAAVVLVSVTVPVPVKLPAGNVMVKGFGEIATVPAPPPPPPVPPPNSTAPASTALLVFLGLLKKSKLGASE
jgi:hypothetical protein